MRVLLQIWQKRSGYSLFYEFKLTVLHFVVYCAFLVHKYFTLV